MAAPMTTRAEDNSRRPLSLGSDISSEAHAHTHTRARTHARTHAHTHDVSSATRRVEVIDMKHEGSSDIFSPNKIWNTRATVNAKIPSAA